MKNSRYADDIVLVTGNETGRLKLLNTEMRVEKEGLCLKSTKADVVNYLTTKQYQN